jgi:hypothetical protein
VEKSSPKIWATSLFSKKLPKVLAQYVGENSPNMVTLLADQFFTRKFFLYSPLSPSAFALFL